MSNWFTSVSVPGRKTLKGIGPSPGAFDAVLWAWEMLSTPKTTQYRRSYMPPFWRIMFKSRFWAYLYVKKTCVYIFWQVAKGLRFMRYEHKSKCICMCEHSVKHNVCSICEKYMQYMQFMSYNQIWNIFIYVLILWIQLQWCNTPYPLFLYLYDSWKTFVSTHFFGNLSHLPRGITLCIPWSNSQENAESDGPSPSLSFMNPAQEFDPLECYKYLCTSWWMDDHSSQTWMRHSQNPLGGVVK